MNRLGLASILATLALLLPSRSTTSAPTAASVFAGVHGTFDTPLERKRPAAP